MDGQTTKDVERAWNGWVVFTKFVTWSVVGVVVILGLMALFLL